MYGKVRQNNYKNIVICPSICPPKPLKPHQIRKEYYPPKPRAEGSSPSAPAKDNGTFIVPFIFLQKMQKLNGLEVGAVVNRCPVDIESRE